MSVTTDRRKELRGKLLVGAAGQIAACVLLLTLGPGSAIWLLVGIALIVASAAQGAFYGRTAGTGSLHHLAMFMLVIGVLFLAITVADRSLHHISSRQDTDRYGPR